jgi:hypothetical protein
MAQVFQYSADNLQSIVALPDQPFTADGFQATFRGESITLFVIKN